MRRTLLALLLAVAASLAAASGAQAVVIDMNALGSPSVSYNAGSQAGYFGVAMVPGTRGTLATANVPVVTSSAPCFDPALSSDLTLPDSGLCAHGGSVVHGNETFALTWDPLRRYWQTSRNYVEQFLADVAKGSGSLGNPYAVTGQYSDAGGGAKYNSVYGGACVDFGQTGSSCSFGATTGSADGHDYPASGCAPTGTNQFNEAPDGSTSSAPNDVCLTDAQLKSELGTIISQTNEIGRTSSGYTPLVVLLTPPGVKVCLDSGGLVCSANATSTAQFCSYHSQVTVDGTPVSYVVQPWTADTACDDPSIKPPQPNPPAVTLATNMASRLVSPISQAHLAALTDPAMNGWFALNGSEVNDNGCVPYADELDSVPVGSGTYYLQREFNNAGVIETDPNALRCTPSVALAPAFVIPSMVNQGDVVEFDGSTTISSLIVPRANYVWSFGDGTGAIGPSVVHSYGRGGNYSVKLTVTDRGGNQASLVQQIAVLGASGTPVPPPPAKKPTTGLTVHIQLLPQSMRSMLRSGVDMFVRSNEPAAGLVSLSISKNAAKQAHIRTGRSASIVVGRGTVSSVKAGTVRMHIRLSRSLASKLARLRHVTIAVRLALVGVGGDRLAIDAAGKY
jgi:hypothetical protein